MTVVASVTGIFRTIAGTAMRLSAQLMNRPVRTARITSTLIYWKYCPRLRPRPSSKVMELLSR